MKRIVTQKLLDWKDNASRKPLIIRGARQVGKSFIISEFGKKHFKGATHVINFERNPEIKSVFEKNFDIIRIVSELEVLTNIKINLGADLLFFDEIQECPKAILALRYFFEQMPNLHVISAGSLLEFALQDISFPVGRVQLLNMHPMNFYEFLLATKKDMLAEIILKKPAELPEAIHLLLLDELKKYFFVGGMPECVSKYTENGSITEVFDIQMDLITTFRLDFSRYANYSDKRCLNSVLNSVAKTVGHQVKYAHLAEKFSNPTIKKAFELLETARLFKKVCASSPEGLPLAANKSEKVFKAVMLDIGILSRISGFSVASEFSKADLVSIFRGAMAEQFVGQEIISATQGEIYYWNRQATGSTAEVDYLIEKNNEIIPIEVKSGASGSLKSLHLLLKTYENVKKSYIFSEARFGENTEQKLVFMPLYYAYGSVV